MAFPGAGLPLLIIVIAISRPLHFPKDAYETPGSGKAVLVDGVSGRKSEFFIWVKVNF